MTMTDFSQFPTAFWAEHSAQKTAVHWEKAKSGTENSNLFSTIPSQISWRKLHRLVQQTATLFISDFQNKTVVYVGSHRLAGLLCYLAVIALGGRILILNPALTATQRAEILADIEFDVVIGDDLFADFSENLIACTLPDWQPNTPATLTLTSGSSGIPKAVVHSAFQHLANARGVCELMDFGAKNSWLLSLPLFHVSGQGIVWRWLLQGATLRINEDKTDFYAVLAKSSHASLVPTQLQRYLAGDKPNLPQQRILLGGSHIPSELIVQAQQKGLRTYAGYGMTETASTICAVEDDWDNVGAPLLGREIRIERGEIQVKGDCLALGYWQKGRLVPIQTEHGWFATKDRGRLNAEGKLQVLGRLDNMFISGGENIQPEQVEQILYRSGLLKNIFILPKDDAEFGHRPVAFVEFLEPFSRQAVQKLQYFAKSALEKFKQPIAYIELNPKLAQSGIKISRKQLQQQLKMTLSEQQYD